MDFILSIIGLIDTIINALWSIVFFRLVLSFFVFCAVFGVFQMLRRGASGQKDRGF